MIPPLMQSSRSNGLHVSSKSTRFLPEYNLFKIAYECVRALEIEVEDRILPKMVCCRDAKHLHIGCGMKRQSTT